MSVLETYAGKLKFHDGTVVDSVLTISDDTLTVLADGIEVGTWPMKYCRASRVSNTEFELTIDGETTWFSPVDPYAFGRAAADRFLGSSIADRINVVRSMPLESMIEVSEPQKNPEPAKRAAEVRRDARRRNTIRVPLLITAGMIALAAIIALFFSMLDDSEPVEEASATTDATVVENVAPGLFMSTPAGLVERWNQTVLDIDARLVIGGSFSTGRFRESLSDQIRLSGDVAGDGTVQSLELSIQPTHAVDETELALAAIGAAIAVADPLMTPEERGMLIRSLGLLYPDDLSLEGIDGEVSRAETVFSLRFYDLAGVDEDLLLFSITEDL